MADDFDDGSGAAADPEVKFDVRKLLGSSSQPHAVSQDQVSNADATDNRFSSPRLFSQFAFRGGLAKAMSGQEAGSQSPVLTTEEEAILPRARLGSLKQPLHTEALHRHRNLHVLSSGGSPAQNRKRQRMGDPNRTTGEEDQATTLPWPKNPRIRNAVIPGLEDDEEEEDEPEQEATTETAAAQESVMRVQVHAKQNYGPQMVDLEQVGELLEEDAVDEVLRQCEGISEKLRKALGSGDDNKCEALEGASRMATPEVLALACGPAARYIKSYQLVGINFLLLLAREGVTGSILADEMGLGKTAQTICFLGCLKELRKDRGPHLVICPASLLENWQRELQRWCPSLSVVAYYGPNRSELRYNLEVLRTNTESTQESTRNSGSEGDSSGESGSDAEFAPDSDDAERRNSHKQAGPHRSSSEPPFNVLLACYTLFERDSTEQKLDRKFLRSWDWSHLILDEAHAVKNSGAMRTVRLNKVAERCKRRIMLTGTPLQNDLEELQNLLRFLMPKLFTDAEASEIQNIKDEVEVERLAERMQALLRPFVLRRLKTEVANQLIAKQHKLHKVTMTPEQARVYADALAELKGTVASAAVLDSGSDSEKRRAEAAKLVKKMGQKKMGNAFVSLRKVAMHPLLTRRIMSDTQVATMAEIARRRDVFSGQATEAKIKAELLGYSDFELHSFALANGSAFKDFVLDEGYLYTSAKCRLLAKLLPELKASGSRPLIFSQWTLMLDILEWLLQCLRLPYVRLDGSTAVAERLTTVDMFNNPENGVFAFLLSTRAGGQGLNLTGADTVILHDVDFNPQVDRQAEDRCHRLGQTRPVTVIRLVTEGTVDEGIHALAEKKLRLDAAVLDGITASSSGQSKAADNLAMSELLQSLLAGDPAGRPIGEDGQPVEVAATEPATLPPDPPIASPPKLAEERAAGVRPPTATGAVHVRLDSGQTSARKEKVSTVSLTPTSNGDGVSIVSEEPSVKRHQKQSAKRKLGSGSKDRTHASGKPHKQQGVITNGMVDLTSP